MEVGDGQDAVRVNDPPAMRKMHEEAHGECFIARSVKCDLTTDWQYDVASVINHP